MKSKQNKSKKLVTAIGIVVMLVACATGMGAMFQFYGKVESSHGVGRLWEIRYDNGSGWTAWEEMGDVVITWEDDTLLGGDSISMIFECRLGGNSQASKSLYWSLTNPFELDGQNCSLSNTTLGTIVDDTNPTDSTLFTAGSSREFTYTISLDAYSPSQTYTSELLATKN